MRCLYCGKQLALFRRLTGGGEFCSDAHKASYQDEFNRLALARLKQAQEKSDELRAAAPQNQLALIRRGSGEPEGPTIRSNAHWIEPKPSRAEQRKNLSIAAPEPPPQPDPKPCEFINAMPAPARFESEPLVLNSIDEPVATVKPEWNPTLAVSELPAAPPLESTLVPSISTPEPVQLPQAEAVPQAMEAVFSPAESLKPEWNPPPPGTELQAAGHVEATVVPGPQEHPTRTEIPVPTNVEMKTQPTSVPPVAPAAAIFPVYPSLPPIAIDALQFAPAVVAQTEMRSQFLPFHFDFTAFPAPDFDVLDPAESPAPQLKIRPRPALKRTEQAHVLDLPSETMESHGTKSVATGPALEMGMIGEIAALANPLTLFPRLASPTEAAETQVLADAVLPQPPAMVMPRSVIGFRASEKTTPAAVSDDQDDKRPSTLKVKLAAMAASMPPPAPPAAPPLEAAAKAASRPNPTPSRAGERKPMERSTGQQQPPRIIATPRRRTVPIPSILELPPEAGDEQKSLWGALRKYLGK